MGPYPQRTMTRHGLWYGQVGSIRETPIWANFRRRSRRRWSHDGCRRDPDRTSSHPSQSDKRSIACIGRANDLGVAKVTAIFGVDSGTISDPPCAFREEGPGWLHPLLLKVGLAPVPAWRRMARQRLQAMRRQSWLIVRMNVRKLMKFEI